MSSVKQYLKNLYVRTGYSIAKPKNEPMNTVVFFMKSGYHQPHPGLVDRLKAIVGLYYTAKSNNMDFIFSHDDSFPLENYLTPAMIAWNRDEDISYSRKCTRLLVHDPRAEVPVLERELQHHCYYYEGKNIIKENNVKNWQQVWSELYHELFNTSDRLKGILDTSLPKGKYVAVHLRFVNALDQFEKHYDSNLSDDEKKLLIEKCLDALRRIEDREKSRLIVFSDSRRFLAEAKGSGFETLNFDNIGHVSMNSSEAVWDKTFLDLYAIAAAETVYSVRGMRLYNSAFSEYASIIGNCNYRIEEIE